MDEDYLMDLFSGLGEVRIKRMFGGQGVYHQERILAVVVDGELLLKADDVSVPEFEAAGCRQWVYEQNGKTGRMPYWSVPGDALDDPELFTPWARLAFGAAMRAPAKKPKRKKA